MAKRINDDTLAILSRVTIEDNNVYLTCGQLDRKQYRDINEVLENIGGKWNKKQKAHVFDGDPTDKLENVLLTGEITPPKKYGYFPTPPEMARTVVKLADILPEHSVLEPSAGWGGLADFITDKNRIDCIELLPDNVEVLQSKGYHRLIQGDFLAIDTRPLYDRVVMNPPFEKQADIDHVLKAWDCLKPGGKLVSIMASSVKFRENKKTVAFRGLIEEYGSVRDNPEGSFKESGTMVNTVTVVLEK